MAASTCVALILSALVSLSLAQCGVDDEFSIRYDGRSAPSFVVSSRNNSCLCPLGTFAGTHVGDGSQLTNLTQQPEVAGLRAQLAILSAQLSSINASGGGGGSPVGTPPSESMVCSSAAAPSTVTVTCPGAGRVARIDFLNYGVTTGTCGSYKATPSCTSAYLVNVVEPQCLGQTTCSVSSAPTAWGDPCPGTAKAVTIQVACQAGNSMGGPGARCITAADCWTGYGCEPETRQCYGFAGTACSTSGQCMPGFACVSSTCQYQYAYAQLENAGGTVGGATFTALTWSAAPIATGITVSGAGITFALPGVYRFSVCFRPGATPDVWMTWRTYSVTLGRGVGWSSGMGTINPDPSVITIEWFADIRDVSGSYQIQFGRTGASAMPVASPAAINGETPPGFQATIQRLHLGYGALEGPFQTFYGYRATPVSFDASSIGLGVSVTGRRIAVTRTGPYRMTLAFRPGATSDEWTGVRVTQLGRSLGHSCGHGMQAPSNPGLASWNFIFEVPVLQPFALEFTRPSQNINAEQMPYAINEVQSSAVLSTVQLITDDFASLEGDGQTFALGWNPIVLARLVLGRGITFSTSTNTMVFFRQAGVYRVTVNWRPGVTADCWNSVRLWDVTASVSVGRAAGMGNIMSSTQDVGIHLVTFLARVTNFGYNTNGHQVQFGRYSSAGCTMAPANPAVLFGEAYPALSVTLERLGA